jgi:hypothetical protein
MQMPASGTARACRLARMTLKKACRRWLASVLAAVLVCLQLVSAAYACATPGRPAQQAMPAMADMPDCPGMTTLDSQQPQLCKAHCDRDKLSVNTSPAADFVAAPMVIDWLISHLALWLPATDSQALPAVMAAHTGPPDGAPPVYIAFLVLRN